MSPAGAGSPGGHFHRGPHGTAFLMAQHQNESGSEDHDCIFDRPECRIIHDISGQSDDEEVAKALIKYELGRGPRVRAREDDGKGRLARRHFRAPVRILVRMLGLASDKTGVACEESIPCGIIRMGRRGQCEGSAGEKREDCEWICHFHMGVLRATLIMRENA